MMQIGVVGSGRIGGNVAGMLGAAGHDVKLSFARDPRRLAARTVEIGHGTSAGTPAEAAAFEEVVICSVPWSVTAGVQAEAAGRTGSERVVHGAEYRLAAAQAVVEAVRERRPIPPTPRHEQRASL